MAKKAKKATAKKGGAKAPKSRSRAATAAALDGALAQAMTTFESYEKNGSRRITKDDFDSLNEAVLVRVDKQGTLRRQMGQLIGNATEHQFLHRKAHGIYRQLDKMEPEKLAEFMFHFLYYLNIGGLFERAASVRSLDLDNDGGENGGEGGEEAGSGGGGEAEPETPAKAAAPADEGNVSRPRFPGAINTKTGAGAFDQPAAGSA